MGTYYLLKDIMDALDFKRTKVQQWIAYGYVRPSIEGASGSGTRNKWSFPDIVMLAAFGELIGMGLSRAAASKLINCTKTFIVEKGKVIEQKVDSDEFFAYYGPDPLNERYDGYLVQFRKADDSFECGIWDGEENGLMAAAKVAQYLKWPWGNVIVIDVGRLSEKIKKIL